MADGINNIFRTSRIAASGVHVSRQWLGFIANNVANKESVDTGVLAADGNLIPYKRQVPILEKVSSENFRDNRMKGDVENGVTVKKVVEMKDVDKVYDPSHPAARKAGTVDAGYVWRPRINSVMEMADAKIAHALHDLSLTVMSIESKMFEESLTIGRGS